MDSAEKYINASKVQYRDAKDVIEEFNYEISKMNGKCIDIGCGPANVSEELLLPALPPDAELIGADISKSMLDYAIQKYNDNKRMSFTSLNIETLELPSYEIEQYDNVISFYCLHWCQNLRLAFENIYKLLRPNGKALVMFLAHNNGFKAYARMNQNTEYQPYLQDISRYIPYYQQVKNPRENLEKMLKNIGFKILHYSKQEKSYTYENQEIFRRHVIAVTPFISRIPSNKKDKFVNMLIREITKEMILLPKESKGNEKDYFVLDKYYILIVYIEKPGKQEVYV